MTKRIQNVIDVIREVRMIDGKPTEVTIKVLRPIPEGGSLGIEKVKRAEGKR